MTDAELRTWFTARGAPDHCLDKLVERWRGTTEDEMDAMYDKHCGPMA